MTVSQWFGTFSADFQTSTKLLPATVLSDSLTMHSAEAIPSSSYLFRRPVCALSGVSK